jgi:anthranilate synthase/indole-3-glycerol phosphate synthase/phosphoribosylanthranilate isomerase
MATAIKLGAKVIGVNNRNLESFEVDLGTTGRLRSMVPEGTFLLALSGINSHQDVLDCKRDGVNGILVGEAIMRAPDASLFIKQLCAGDTTPASKPKVEPLLVKICGTRSAEAATEAIKAGADLIGIILVPGTKRCVSDETALAISKAVHSSESRQVGEVEQPSKLAKDFFTLTGETIRKRGPLLVGVFMNQPLEEVLEKQRAYNLDIVQLHGNEPLEWANLIPVPVTRRFKPGQPGIGLRGYHAVSLLDPGEGSGARIDLGSVKAVLEMDDHAAVLLAGGLTPNNVIQSVAALGSLSDRLLGVDVSSGVEVDGKQDVEKIRAFVRAAKAIR